MLPILQIRELRPREIKGPAPERNGRSRENLRSLVPDLRLTLLKGLNHRGAWEGGVGGLRA